MVHCMDMGKHDWDVCIEGIGLETAMQQWEARPQASKPIDKEWRTAAGGKLRRKVTTTPAELMDRADSSEAELDDYSGVSSEADEDTEDEFAEFPRSQEETDGWAVDEETNAKSGDAQT